MQLVDQDLQGPRRGQQIGELVGIRSIRKDTPRKCWPRRRRRRRAQRTTGTARGQPFADTPALLSAMGMEAGPCWEYKEAAYPLGDLASGRFLRISARRS